MSLLNNFPHKCTVRRRVHRKDGYGGKKIVYVNELYNVYCWIQPASDAEDGSFQKEGTRNTYKVYFKTNPGVTSRHQILITYQNGAAVDEPIPMDVVSLPLPDCTAGLGVCYRVMCVYLQSEND